MWEILFNTEKLKEWVEAAKTIHARFGIEKALGYLIGEKFYHVVFTLHSSKELLRMIAEERKKPGYRPSAETTYKNRTVLTNMDEIYEKNIEVAKDTEEALTRFAVLINDVFESHQIKSYLESNPRLGIHGHIASEEDYDFLVSRGAVEHSIDTEVRDALILGDMMKYLGISLNAP
jgi:hypothetical protein